MSTGVNHTTRRSDAKGARANRQRASSRPPTTSTIVATIVKMAVFVTAFQKIETVGNRAVELLKPTNSTTACGLIAWKALEDVRRTGAIADPASTRRPGGR